MSVIIVLVGGLLLFANPDLRQDTYRAELGVSSLSGSASSGSESIKGGTLVGWGVSLTGEYRDETPLRHSLGLQRYESNTKSLEFYTLGLDYVFQWPERPLQFAFGAEAGSVQLLPKGMNSIDAGTAKLGWELHGEAMHYFVFRNQLVHAYVRPAWRVYQPELEAGGITEKFNAGGLSLTGGMGIQF